MNHNKLDRELSQSSVDEIPEERVEEVEVLRLALREAVNSLSLQTGIDFDYLMESCLIRAKQQINETTNT